MAGEHRYCVITALADPNVSDGGSRDGLLFRDKNGRLWAECYGLKDADIVAEIQVPVYHVGELLVLDQNGREVHGPIRVPDHWFVDYEIYASFQDAVERAIEATNCHDENLPLPPPRVAPVGSSDNATMAPKVEEAHRKSDEAAGLFECPRCAQARDIKERGVTGFCKRCDEAGPRRGLAPF